MALVEAALFYNSFEAGLARSFLAQNGIDSFLFDFHVGTEGPGPFPIRLMVDEEEIDEARRLLEAGAEA